MTTSPESGHVEPTSPVDWVKKHLEQELKHLSDYCDRKSIDDERRLALQGIYLKAISDLDNLPPELPLNQAIESIYYGAQGDRDTILFPPEPPSTT